MKVAYKTVFILGFVMFLISCGSGSGDNEDKNSSNWPPATENEVPDSYGFVIDSPVAGLRYVSGKHYGVTDDEGRFGYIEDENVQFFIGDIRLGVSVMPSARVTPFELAGSDASVAINIARFLQTLDDDGEPSNGIIVNDAVHSLAEGVELNFASAGWIEKKFFEYEYEVVDDRIVPIFSDEELAIQQLLTKLNAATSVDTVTLVSGYDAYTHFSTTLNAIIDSLETEANSVASRSLCSSDDQCEIVSLLSRDTYFCGSDGPVLTYSTLDIELGVFDEIVNERGALIGVKTQLESEVDSGIDWTGSCLSYSRVPYAICGEDSRCEVR